MDTNEGVVITGRRRRTHSDEFKRQVVMACGQHGVSMAAVAMAHGINANLLRRWVVQDSASSRVQTPPVRSTQSVPAFIPLALPAPAAAPAETADIRIELKRGAMTVDVRWPASSADACAAWLRELLR